MRPMFGAALVVVFALVAVGCGDDDDVSPIVPTDAAPSADGSDTADGSAPTDDAGADADAAGEDRAGSSDSADDSADDGTAEDGGSAAVLGDGTFPITIETASGDVTIPERPVAIVSLSATATEILFAIGAGRQVAAVDSQSNFPAEAPLTELSAFDANVEAIADLEPDLVVLSFDPGETVSGLEALGIPTILQPAAATLEDSYTQIEQLGAATGNIANAASVVGGMEADITSALTRVPDYETPPTYFHELDDLLFTATSSTFIGELYALAGLENIADAAEGADSGFPQLSAEYLLDQDPDFIFLADTICCGQTAETVAARPGFDELSAVRDGRVIELDDDVASRWGPRVVELLEQIVAATSTAGVG